MAGSVDVGTLRAKLGLDASGFEKGVAGAKHEMKGLAKEMTAILPAMAGLAASFGVFELFKEFTRDGMAFAHTMETVGGVFRSTQEEMEKVKEAAISFSERSSQSANQIGRGFYFLASAGFTAVQAIEAMPTVLNLAKIGEMEIARSTDIAVNAMRGMGKETKDLAGMADVMVGTFTRMNSTLDTLAESYTYVVPIGKAFGYTFEELNAQLGVLSNSGVKGSMAGTQLAMAIQRANEVAIKLKFSSGDLIDVLEEMGKQGYTNADIMDMFGQRAGRAALILAQNTAQVRALTDTLQTVGGETTVLAAKMSSSAQSAFGRLKGLWKSLGDSVYESYQKRLIEVLEGTWNWIDKNREVIVKFLSAIMQIITEVIGAFSTFAGILAAVGTAAAQALGLTIEKLIEVHEEAKTTSLAIAEAFHVPPMTDWDKMVTQQKMRTSEIVSFLSSSLQVFGAFIAGVSKEVVMLFVNAQKVASNFMAWMEASGKAIAKGKFFGGDSPESKNLAAAKAAFDSSVTTTWSDAVKGYEDYNATIERIDQEQEDKKNWRTPEQQWDFEHGLKGQRQFLDVARIDNEKYFSEIQAMAKYYADQEGMTTEKLAERKRQIWADYDENRAEMLAQEIADGRTKFGLSLKDEDTLRKGHLEQMKKQLHLFFSGTDTSKATILPKGGAGGEDADAAKKALADEQKARERAHDDVIAGLRDLLKSQDLTAAEMSDVWTAYYMDQEAKIGQWAAAAIAAGQDVAFTTKIARKKIDDLLKEQPGYKTDEMRKGQADRHRAMVEAWDASEARYKDQRAQALADEQQRTRDSVQKWVDIADGGFRNISDIMVGFFMTAKGEWADFHRTMLDMLGSLLSSLIVAFGDAAAQKMSGAKSMGGWLVDFLKGGGPAEATMDTGVDLGVVYEGERMSARGGIFNRPTRSIIGEAGPEAVIPLSRFRDPAFTERLTGTGQHAATQAAAPVTVYIQTPDAQSFRASSSQVAARIALAVRAGQRSMA
jgi:TP901 family phage tail tape measure protein